jgi:hypothetical protein
VRTRTGATVTLLALASLSGASLACSTALAHDAEPLACQGTRGQTQAIDAQVWRPLIAASNAFDWPGYLALHAADLVRVAEVSGDVYGFDRHAREIEQGFQRVRARGDTTRTTEVSFLSRRQAGGLARDTGYFRSRASRNGAPRTSFTHFDFILRCDRGVWRILVDRDANRTPPDASGRTRAITEADFLAATPLSPAPPPDAGTLRVSRTTRGPKVDGTIGAGEWGGATRVELAPGVFLRATHDARRVYLAFDAPQAAGWGFGVLYLAHGAEVSVLHASAKTGSARYRPDSSSAGRWSPESTTYDWKDAATLEAQEGWRADVATGGGASAREFVVLRDRIEGARVAFAYVQQAGEAGRKLHLWPAGLTDGAASLALIEGRNPPGLEFATERWMSLELLPLPR